MKTEYVGGWLSLQKKEECVAGQFAAVKYEFSKKSIGQKRITGLKD